MFDVMNRSKFRTTSRAVSWQGGVTSVPVAMQVPVVSRAQACQFGLVPLTCNQLFLCLAAAGVDRLDMFFLLAAFTIRDLLYVSEDILE